MTRSVFVAKRVRAFHHSQYATHHGAAALRVVVHQAQSAQSFLIPQPVLRRVQHAVAAQHLKHKDKPCSGTTAAQTSQHTEACMEYMTPHTPSESRIHFHLPVFVSSPSGCWDQLTFLQDLYFRLSVGTRHMINNLSANQTLHCIYTWQLLYPPWRDILMKPLG